MDHQVEASLPTGPYGYYKLDGNTDDSSSYDKDGTNNGVSFSNGKIEQGGYFDGSDYIDCGGASHFDFDWFGISVWIKQSSADKSGLKYIIVKGQSSGWQYGLCLQNGIPKAKIWQSGGSDYAAVDSGINIADNTWHHVAISFSNDVFFRMYLDGVLVDEADYFIEDNYVSNSYNLLIGKRSDGYYFKGYLDDIRIFNYPFYQNHIDALTLLGHFELNQNGNDVSGYGYSGTVSGVTYESGQKSYCGIFDGSDHINCDGEEIYSMKRFSITTWVKQADADKNGAQYIAVKGSYPSWQYGFYLSNGVPIAKVWQTGGSDHAYVNTGVDIADGRWHHLAMVWSPGSSLKVFIDGKMSSQDTSFSGAQCVSTSHDLLIGKRSDGYHLKGKLDDLKIFGRIIDQETITNMLLVGYWKLDNDVNDASGFGNSGTNSGVSFHGNQADGTHCGRVYYTDYINCGNDESLSVEAFSISAWIKQPSNWKSGTQWIVAKGSYPDWQYGLFLYNGEPRMKIWEDGGEDVAYVSSGVDIADNTWHHIAVTWTPDTTLKIYIDGLYEDEDISVSSYQCVSTNDDLFIGKRSDGNYLYAYVDDIRLYAMTLSQSDILAMSSVDEIDLDNDALTNEQEVVLLNTNPEKATYICEYNYFSGCQPPQDSLNDIEDEWESQGYEFVWVNDGLVTNNWGTRLDLYSSSGKSREHWIGSEGQEAVEAYFDNGNDLGKSSTHHYILFCDDLYDLHEAEDLNGISTGYSVMFVAIDSIDDWNGESGEYNGNGNDDWTMVERARKVIQHEIGHTVHYNKGDDDECGEAGCDGHHDTTLEQPSVMFIGFPLDSHWHLFGTYYTPEDGCDDWIWYRDGFTPDFHYRLF